MDIILTDGVLIRIQEKNDGEEDEKLRCSTQCPFFKSLEWEPDNIMDAGRLTFSCLMTDHSFGWKKNPFGNSFEIVRTAECVAKDPDPEVVPRREKYVQAHGLGEPYPVGSGYTLVIR